MFVICHGMDRGGNGERGSNSKFQFSSKILISCYNRKNMEVFIF